MASAGNRSSATGTSVGFVGTLTSRVIACLLIVVCFAVGAVGLILPVIPGLLFVAIALMLIARYFPSADRWLRKNHTIRSYLNSAEGFGKLSFVRKLQYGCLLCLRLFVDTVALLVYGVARVMAFAVGRYQTFR